MYYTYYNSILSFNKQELLNNFHGRSSRASARLHVE